MRIMNRKIWIILLAVLLAMDVLTACTPSTGPNPAKEPTASVEVPAGFELMDMWDENRRDTKGERFGWE